MSRVRGEGKRALVDIAVETCGGPGPSEQYSLIATDAATLATEGPMRVATDGLATGRGRVGTTGHDGGLQTLVLARHPTGHEVEALWVLDGWSMLRADGEAADLRAARLRGAQLRGARLRGADLRDADLTGADLEKADLGGADLTGATLAGGNLFSASLQDADLTEADLCRTNLRHVDMRRSVCVRTAFRGADMWRTYMWDVDLSQAFVVGADLERADYLNTIVAR